MFCLWKQQNNLRLLTVQSFGLFQKWVGYVNLLFAFNQIFVPSSRVTMLFAPAGVSMVCEVDAKATGVTSLLIK